MPTDATLLAGVPFFQYLDDDEREILARQLDAVRIPAGQLVFQVNDPGGTMFVIRQGSVEVFFKDDTGERIVLETPGPARCSAKSPSSTPARAPPRSWLSKNSK